jgi:hypothetical protein
MLYAYCLAEEVDKREIDAVVGVAGNAPGLISYGGILAVTSEFAGKRVELSRENVYSHERVIGLVTAKTSPLPFRFGTLVSRLELDHYVETNKRSLLDLLARVRGSIEMSVKIICPPEPAGGEAAEPEVVNSATGSLGTGALFLAAKRREIRNAEYLNARSGEIATWLAESLGSTVRDSRIRLRPSAGLAVAAAHLVEKGRLDEYRERLVAARRSRSNLHFLTSGPWPPYSFVDLCCDLLDSRR